MQAEIMPEKATTKRESLIFRLLAATQRVFAWIFVAGGLINIGYAFMNGRYPVKLLFVGWPEDLSLVSWLIMIAVWLAALFLPVAGIVLFIVRQFNRRDAVAALGLTVRAIGLVVISFVLLIPTWYENFREVSDPSLFVEPRAALRYMPVLALSPPPAKIVGEPEEEPKPTARDLFLR